MDVQEITWVKTFLNIWWKRELSYIEFLLFTQAHNLAIQVLLCHWLFFFSIIYDKRKWSKNRKINHNHVPFSLYDVQSIRPCCMFGFEYKLCSDFWFMVLCVWNSGKFLHMYKIDASMMMIEECMCTYISQHWNLSEQNYFNGLKWRKSLTFKNWTFETWHC